MSLGHYDQRGGDCIVIKDRLIVMLPTNELTPWTKDLLEKDYNFSAGSFSYFRRPANCPYPKPDKYSPFPLYQPF